MYLARFSYDVLPVNRQRAIDFIRREVEAARGNGLNARMLVPLTRGHGEGAALREFARFDSEAKRRTAILRAVEKVARHLGNTPAICRRCYIHPAILDGYLDGSLLAALAAKTANYLKENVEGMSAEEAAVTAFLRLRLGELAEERRSERPRSDRPPSKEIAAHA